MVFRYFGMGNKIILSSTFNILISIFNQERVFPVYLKANKECYCNGILIKFLPIYSSNNPKIPHEEFLTSYYQSKMI
jgi:hypothetical protein